MAIGRRDPEEVCMKSSHVIKNKNLTRTNSKIESRNYLSLTIFFYYLYTIKKPFLLCLGCLPLKTLF